MKWIIFSLLINESLISFSLPTALSPGDLAIIGFNFKNPDEFSFITFKDLQEGTVIYFTDCGWQNNGLFRKGEGLITYTVPTGGKKANEVITYPKDTGFATEGISGFFGLAIDGDQLFAFQGSFDFPKFIFGLTTYNNDWQNNATDNHTSSLPSDLSTIHAYVNFDFAMNGSYQCVSDDYASQNITLNSIINPTNWTTSSERIDLPGTCFNTNLPIVFIQFELKKVNEETKAMATISVDEITEVELQESDDGGEFKKLESIFVNEGITTITFHNSLIGNYYRLMVKKNLQTKFSVILSNPDFTEEQIISTIVYNLQGEILESISGPTNSDTGYFKNKFNQTFIVKQVHANGITIITKYISAP